MPRPVVVTAVVLGCVLLASRLSSQSSQQPTPTFRAGVDLVQLDVSVLDQNRRPVKGLTAADFTVLENGVPQPIVAFEAVDIPDPVDPPAGWMRDVPADVATNDSHERRVIVIVLDDAFMPLDAGPMAKKIARAVVDGMGPADVGAVTFTDSGRRQDVTNDRQRLLKAIDSLVPHPSPPAAAIGLRAERLGGRRAGGCAFRGKYRSPAACVLDTLVTAAEALRSASQGRKTLVYISGGVPFDFSMTDLRGGDPPPGEEITAIQAVLRTMQEANVNVYAIDPSGLTAEGIMGPRLDSLRMFSEDTGGRTTIATNTPWDAVPQIFRENSSYYLLGIRASPTAREGTFKRVQIKVDRAGVEVRARSGYVAGLRRAPGETMGSSPVEQAIAGPLSGGVLPVRIAVAPFATPDPRTTALAIAVGLPQVSASPRTLDVLVMALDADCGDCKKLPSQRRIVTVAPRAPGGGSSAELLARLDLPPGSYEIRAAAASEGESGSVLTHVDIPAFSRDRFSLSGLILANNTGPAGAEGTAPDRVIPLAPTTNREFRPDASVTAFVRIYQGGSRPPGAVRVTATIRDDRDRLNLDQTTFIDAAAFAQTRSKDFRLDLPVAALEPGPHLLTIDAHMGDLGVRRDARFFVR